MSERFEESDTSKKLERSPAYHIAKDIGKAGLSASVTVYDGLEEALTILGKSSAEATVDLIDHKYGSQAGNASEEATKILANVGGMYQEVKKVAVTNLAKITVKETAKNLLNEKK